MSRASKALLSLAAEVIFALFPLVVLIILRLDNHTWLDLFSAPEWAVGASILFGQALVRFVSGIVGQGQASAAAVGLAVAGILVLGLCPSLILMTDILQSIDVGEPIGPWQRGGQVTLFGLAITSYLSFGAVGDLWDRH